MNIIFPFLIGFFVSAIGIIPPGLINITAAKVSLKDGKNKAISFVFGACLVIFFQTLIALFFAHFINNHPLIILSIKKIGFIIFSALSLFFFWKARKKNNVGVEIKVRSKTNRYFYGVLLASLNLFPIPYYVFVSITLASYGFFSFNNIFIYTFVLGAVSGSFFIFYTYIIYFKKQEYQSSFLLKNGNYIFAIITGLVSIITLIKILESYL